MSVSYIHECITCTLQAVMNGETSAEAAFSELADGDAAAHHKDANPKHVIVVHETYWE